MQLTEFMDMTLLSNGGMVRVHRALDPCGYSGRSNYDGYSAVTDYQAHLFRGP